MHHRSTVLSCCTPLSSSRFPQRKVSIVTFLLRFHAPSGDWLDLARCLTGMEGNVEGNPQDGDAAVAMPLLEGQGLDPAVTLPEEIFVKGVLAWLGISTLVATCTRISKLWHRLCYDEHLWKEMYVARRIVWTCGGRVYVAFASVV